MSVRIEWTTAQYAGARWIEPGEPAPDGQTTEYGGGALIIGALAIEGTPEELRALLGRAAAVIPGGPLQLASLLQEAVLTEGSHHKQWYLEQLAAALGLPLQEHEPGIAP